MILYSTDEEIEELKKRKNRILRSFTPNKDSLLKIDERIRELEELKAKSNASKTLPKRCSRKRKK